MIKVVLGDSQENSDDKKTSDKNIPNPAKLLKAKRDKERNSSKKKATAPKNIKTVIPKTTVSFPLEDSIIEKIEKITENEDELSKSAIYRKIIKSSTFLNDYKFPE